MQLLSLSPCVRTPLSLVACAKSRGIVCTRYEVKDIDPPETIMQAMKAEAEAERKKRAVILESEGSEVGVNPVRVL